MVPTMTTILQRFTGEWALLLQAEAILTVCREIGYVKQRRPKSFPFMIKPRQELRQQLVHQEVRG